MEMMVLPTIGPFRGKWSCFSNFDESYPVECFDKKFKTREHLYHLLKCATDHPEWAYWRDRILDAETPGKAKHIGYKIPCRPDWSSGVRINAMIFVVGLGLIQHPRLQGILKGTKGHTLVEFNTHHDNFWGQDVRDLAEGISGLNMLGTIYMGFRDGHFSLDRIQCMYDILMLLNRKQIPNLSGHGVS